jgi:hypothetical protein
MQYDESYYAEVEKLASILHERKGNPRTGALDSWNLAESIIRGQGVLARRSFEELKKIRSVAQLSA